MLEAARVDGANEWQVFRRVTVPLLAPVLIVVLVTLMINVLKVFDLVFVIAPGSVAARRQRDRAADVGGVRRCGTTRGSAARWRVFLFVLVLPAMVFNIRRFRAER